MGERTCAIDDCSGTVDARGWCRAHYRRWQRYGDPLGRPATPQPLTELTCRRCGFTGSVDGFRHMHGRPIRLCRPCHAADARAYHHTHRDDVLPKLRAGYRRRCGDADWLKRERQRLRDLRQQPDQVIKAREYRRINSAKAVARAAEWAARNPDRARESSQRAVRKRRAIRRAVEFAPITAADLAAKIAYWSNQCWICSEDWDQIDHVKPISKGGPHVLANLRPICGTCNRRKAARWPLADMARSSA